MDVLKKRNEKRRFECKARENLNRSDKCEMRRHHSRASLPMIQHGAGKIGYTCEKSVSVRCPRKSTLRVFLSRSYDFCCDGMHSTPALTRSRTTRPASDTSSLAVEMGFYRRPDKVKLPVNQLHWNPSDVPSSPSPSCSNRSSTRVFSWSLSNSTSRS